MSTIQYMLALDPGGTTGYCHAEWNGEELTLMPGQRKFTSAELFAYLHDSWQKNFHLIYERFDYRNRARAGLDLTPARLIGVIELFIETERLSHYPQTASEAMGFWTDERLRQYQIYQKGIQHGRDAMRHLLHWWQFKAGYQFHDTSPFTRYILIPQD